MYPNLGLAQPTFDQYGNQCSVNPLVAKSTAGSLAPGQSLFSSCGRVATSTSAAITFVLCNVPSNMVLFVTDFYCSTAGSAEVDTQLQSGAIPIGRASVFNTSPAQAMFETQPMVIGGNMLSIVVSLTTSSQNVDFYVAGYLQQLGS